MKPLLITACLLLAPSSHDPAEDNEVPIYAFITSETLEVGGEYELEIFVDLPEAANASKSGAPAPFLQIDVPPSIELGGRYLRTYQELSQNEFLQEPYERLLEENPARIPFKVVAQPGEGERIGLNILAYVKPGGEKRDFFLRRRFELPVEAGVDAEEVAAENSGWGVDEELLQIGDPAVDFELPRADGTKLKLSDYLGKSNVIVTTYRAFW